MFTGIVEGIGRIEGIERGGKSLSLSVHCPFAAELENGESVAVNGTCLTVTEKSDSVFHADVTPETFRRTSLSELTVGSSVNLERAMKADGRFGGHIVSGHIDGTGTIAETEREGNAVWVCVSTPKEILDLIVQKGSIAIDGISLTLAYVDDDCFKVSVIPHTGEETILLKKKPGV